MKIRSIIVAAAALGAAIAASSAASAQTYGGDYPVCLQNYAPVQYIECRYTSIPQCQLSASGRSATCLVNPYFVETAPPERRVRRHRS
jgi:hypothetical protein